MKISFAHTFRKYNKKNLPKDILAGIIIAAVSIPISMGYAQISGLPAVYGLYGSVFPILVFALFSTSPQFIFGVDAAPAALVGSALLTMNITPGSESAIQIVPVITFLVAVWLFIFTFFKAGKLVSYISAPVMGGFITGICTEIILMQVPKLMGETAGTGELPELLKHISEAISSINMPSLLLGICSLAILIASKKIIPKFPMSVLLMIIGVILTCTLPIQEVGIHTLNAVAPGLPPWRFPALSAVSLSELVTISLSVAVVIMAETLLAENNFALKNGYRVDCNQELLAFSLGNLLASLTGCCPINGSVSRTAMNEQYQGKTQLTSVVAGLAMIIVLLFGTDFIQYLPVPVLTAIVISALIGATEFSLAKRLWKINKTECLIFFGAFFGVLLLGTINGVLIGVILSFTEVIIRSAKPSRCFLGIQPGHSHFRDLKDSEHIHPVKGIVIYRFSSSLFFANAEILQSEIEDSIKPDTKAVILDASGISSLDITAADRLALLYKSLKDKGIRFYMTEHISALNDQLRTLGLGYLIEEGAVRRTIHICLKDMGINRPYPLEGDVENESKSRVRRKLDNGIQEFAWAFGKDTEKFLENQIRLQLSELKNSKDIESLIRGNWAYKDEFDMDEWLEHLEEHIKEIEEVTGMDEHTLIEHFEKDRDEIHQRMMTEHPELSMQFQSRKAALNERLKEKHPEVYQAIRTLGEIEKRFSDTSKK